jgi:peptide/nickel transport system ATP-binding protein
MATTERLRGPDAGTNDTEHLLEIKDLRTYFTTARGVLRAVDGVDLVLQRGKTLGIVGESGSGKSVLSRSIMNLLPPTAMTGGSIIFRGRDVQAMSPAERRKIMGRHMAMILQDPMTSLNPVVRIGRHITESLQYHLGMNKEQAKARALDLMKAARISEPERRLDQHPHELSGGMRQRVTIAIALACNPELLLADEPTTALDVTVQQQILDLLLSLQKEHNMGMMLVTHDLGVVAGRTDEVAVMYAGRIVEKAPTRVLFKQMRHPYTEALLKSIPRVEYHSHTRLRAIPGRPPEVIDPPPRCSFAPRCRYAQPKCLQETPPLVPTPAPGHLYACFFPVGTAEGEDALFRNRRDGATATGRSLTEEDLA